MFFILSQIVLYKVSKQLFYDFGTEKIMANNPMSTAHSPTSFLQYYPQWLVAIMVLAIIMALVCCFLSCSLVNDCIKKVKQIYTGSSNFFQYNLNKARLRNPAASPLFQVADLHLNLPKELEEEIEECDECQSLNPGAPNATLFFCNDQSAYLNGNQFCVYIDQTPNGNDEEEMEEDFGDKFVGNFTTV